MSTLRKVRFPQYGELHFQFLLFSEIHLISDTLKNYFS